ncbi:MAG: sigma-70 family RNA polymerase sigma factor [Planctomycetaceae bacterium]|nr:sigma-70 family RNA polymerase sigma factor [Planctomycetaceae bacterium]
MDAHTQAVDGWLLDLGREQRAVARLAAGLVADPEEARDLAQSAWLVFARRRPSGEAGLLPWWRAVLRRERAQDVRRARSRAAREQVVFEERTAEAPDAWLERTELTRVLIDEVRALAQPAQRLLGMRYGRGMELKEIARALGEPEGTVRARHHRALAQLRTRLETRLGPGRDWRRALYPIAATPLPARSTAALRTAFAEGLAHVAASAGLWALSAGALVAAGAVLWWTLGRGVDPGSAGVPEGPTTAWETPGERSNQTAVAAAEPEFRGSAASPRPGSRLEVLAAGAPASAALRSAVGMTLVDPEGRAVAGARVEGDIAGTRPVGRWDPRRLLVAAHAVASDHEGRAELGTDLLRAPQFVELRATGPGNLHWSQELWVAPGETVELGRVTMEPAAHLHVRTTDEEGRPLRAQLELETLDGPPPPRAPAPAGPRFARSLGDTNRRGEWTSGPLAAGWVRVWATAEGYEPAASAPLDLRAGPPQSATIQLPAPPVRDPLRVFVAAPDGSPAAGAQVTASADGSSRSFAVPASGQLRFDEFGGLESADRLFVSDHLLRGSPVERRALHSSGGEVRVTLAPLETALLRATSRGSPVPSFRVVLRAEDPYVKLVSVRGNDGRAEVVVPAFDGFHLSIHAEGQRSFELREVSRTQLRGLGSVDLSPRAFVQGRVQFAGRGIAGAEVSLRAALPPGKWMSLDGFPTRVGLARGAPARTDADGKFALALATPGEWYLTIDAPGCASLLRGPMFLGGTSDIALGDFVVEAGGELHVRVVDGTGRPRPGQRVAVTRSGVDGRTERADAEGWARFRTLGSGHWHVYPTDREPLALPGIGSWIEGLELVPEWEYPRGVAVSDGALTSVKLVVAPQPVTLTLRVPVEVPSDWRVRAETDFTRDPLASVWSETEAPAPDGQVLLQLPDAGPYRLQLFDPIGTLRKQLDLEATPELGEVVLEPEV